MAEAPAVRAPRCADGYHLLYGSLPAQPLPSGTVSRICPKCGERFHLHRDIRAEEAARRAGLGGRLIVGWRTTRGNIIFATHDGALWVFDINCGWQTGDVWRDQVAPALIAAEKRRTGWHASHRWGIARR